VVALPEVKFFKNPNIKNTGTMAAFPGSSFPADGKARSSVLLLQKRFKSLVSMGLEQVLSHLTIRQKISYGYALLIGIVILGTGTGLLLGDYYQQQAANRVAHAEEQENLFRSLKITVIEAQEHQQRLPLLVNNSKQFEYEYSQVQERITRVKELLVDEATSALKQTEVVRNQIIVASMLLSIAIAAALSSYTSRAIAYPLKAATKVTVRLTEETNLNLQIPSTTKDEIGQLTTSLNQLLQRVANDTQELKQTTAELERFFNLSLDMFCIAGFNGYFQRLNRAFETHLGYTPKELLSIRFLDLVHPQDRAATSAEMQKLLAGVTVRQFENRYRCKDGSYKWLAWTATPFTPERLIYAVARDMSDRKKAEEKLLRIGKAVESTSDAIGMADITGRSIYHNPAFIDLFEYTVEELNAAGGPAAIYANFTDAQTVFTTIQSGCSWHGEVTMRSRNGRIMKIALRADAIKDETDEIIGLIGIHTDVTERKHVEEELRQSEAKYRELAQREALLNQLASQIRSSLDLNTILETAVQEIRNLLQIDRCFFLWYRPDEETPVWEFVQEARSAAFPSIIGYRVSVSSFGPLTTRVFNKEITRVDNARVLTDPVERKFFFSIGYTALLALPIHTTSGEVGVVSCGHSSGARPWREEEVELLRAVADQLAIAINQAELYKQSHIAAITAQEQATTLEQTLRELQQTQAQLVQSEKMSSLGQMVAGVAHEINNPINFIYGNLSHADQYAQDLLHLVQLYQEQYPNPATVIQAEIEAIELDFIREDLPKILSSMKMGADRIREIVLSLRNFSRLDESEMKWVDVHEGLNNTLLILAHRLKAKQGEHLDIQVIKDYGKLPPVQCYAGQLNQVFMNILTNAIEAIEDYNKEYSPEDIKKRPNTIWICTQVVDSDQVVILIGDNGPGMTEDVRTKLFDPFFTTKPVGQGTGLGMSISYQIVVEKHGGQLECISAPDQGTTFLIQIPIQQNTTS
jgi:PAS domain S-box-containing protein